MKRSLTLFAVIVLAVGGSSAQQLVAAKDRSAQARSAPQLGSPKTAVVKAFGRARGTLRLSYASFGLTVNLKGKRGAKPLVWRVSVTKSGVSVARALVGMTTAELRYVAGTGARCSAKACTWHAAGGTVTASLRADHVTRLGLRAPAGNPAGLKLKRGKKGGRLGVTVSDIPKGAAAVVAVNGPGGFVRVLARTSTLSKLSPGLYTIGADTIHAGKYSYVPTPARRSVRVKNARKSGASVSYLTVLPDTTKAATAAAVLSVTGKPGKTQKVTLDESDLGFSPLAPGDILALGVGPKTPYGFFGKVVSVTDNGGQEIVTTAPAKLVEAIPQGHIAFTRTLSTASVHATAFTTGKRGTTRVGLRASDLGVKSPISKNVSCGGSANLDLSGNAGLTPTITFDMNWGWGGLSDPLSYKLKSALFQVAATETVSLTAKASAALKCELGPAKVFEFTFPPIDIQVGPFPVIFVPKFEIEVGASATVAGAVTIGVTQTLTASAGVKYDDGWKPVGSLKNSFTVTRPATEYSAAIEASATGKFSLLWMDLVGPYVALGPSLELSMSPGKVAPDPWWALTGKLQAGAGINVSLFGLLEVDWGKPDILSYSKVLAKGVKYPPVVNPEATPAPVSTGAYHTCALVGGGVKCWGYNILGQLGNGTTGTPVQSATPVSVVGLSGVTSVSSGGNHSCALISGGTIKCWGSDTYGQLGNGGGFGDSPSPTPVQVTGITNAVDVSTGGTESCAVLATGVVKCWGDNQAGELGDGKGGIGVVTATPVTVSGISNAKSVSVGSAHACAVLAGQKVKCWGDNGYGELGDGTTTERKTPVAVSELYGAVAVSAGGEHTCALISNHAVRCWGRNNHGQLGNGTTTNSAVPVPVSGLDDAIAIDAGWGFNCARLSGDSVACWGSNVFGELGNGTTASSDPYGSTTPVDVSGISDAVSVSASEYGHACSALSGGTINCWGYNSDGELGNGKLGLNSNVPVEVKNIPPP